MPLIDPLESERLQRASTGRRHQVLIDGLSALVLLGQLEKARAERLIARFADLPDVADGPLLRAIRIDLGLPPDWSAGQEPESGEP